MNFDQLVKQEFLTKASGIILENLDNDQFEVSAMAREMGMSRSNLYRKTRHHAGVSPSEYIRKVKLGKAMDLLKESSASITEIAYECGFQSLTYFDTCFRKQYGLPPSKIRNNKAVRGDDITISEEKILSLSVEPKSESSGNIYHNFPVPATRFIGRKKEIEWILKLVKTSRIVSLVGSGGCGKTRLACEVVTNLENDFKDGIWFVDLAPVESGGLVVKEIMEALKVKETGSSDLLETLAQRIGGMELLIVLDNCEHLADNVADTSKKLVQKVPGLKLLITSRATLNIQDEIVWRVPSMSLEDPTSINQVDEAEKSEAILLFADRARMSDQRFRLSDRNIRDIATICKDVDGMPLALELVANRIRHLDPGEILERFSSRFSDIRSPDPGTVDRHKTMNATIDWSYRLLTDEEKMLFRRLSVFAGGFQLEAVEEICTDPSFPREYVVDLISNLVDHSMILTIREQDKPLRYKLLEPIKQYAARQLDAVETRKIRRRHLEYLIEFAENAFNGRFISQEFWMSRLESEHDNMMAALNWAEDFNFKKYSQLTGLLAWFWARSNKYQLAKQKLGDLIEKGKIRNENKARILAGYAWSVAGEVEKHLHMMKFFRQCPAIWKRLGNKKEEVVARTDLAAIYFGTNRVEAAVQLIMETYTMAQKLDDRGVLLYCMIMISQAYVSTKRFDEARAFIKVKLELAEELENPFAKFAGHHNLGDCELMEGKFKEAEREYGEGVKITMQFGDMYYLFTDLAGVAMAVSGMGRYVKAFRLMGGINALTKKEGMMSPENGTMSFWQEQIKLHITDTREKLGVDLVRKYEAEGASMDLEEVIVYALDFDKD
ncbi:MAG: helix-turn-helix domain-containing protein [Bacteroidales bacterium]